MPLVRDRAGKENATNEMEFLSKALKEKTYFIKLVKRL